MKTRDGFTLIELMIVVVIIGILASIAIPRFNAVTRGAKEAEAAPILKQLYTLQERYKQRHGSYAVDMTHLEGGVSSFGHARYYDFQLTADQNGTAFVACASPKAGLTDLQYFIVDSDGELEARTSCS